MNDNSCLCPCKMLAERRHEARKRGQNGVSEYMDTISRLGANILKNNVCSGASLLNYTRFRENDDSVRQCKNKCRNIDPCMNI